MPKEHFEAICKELGIRVLERTQILEQIQIDCPIPMWDRLKVIDEKADFYFSMQILREMDMVNLSPQTALMCLINNPEIKAMLRGESFWLATKEFSLDGLCNIDGEGNMYKRRREDLHSDPHAWDDSEMTAHISAGKKDHQLIILTDDDTSRNNCRFNFYPSDRDEMASVIVGLRRAR